jgi:RimJ/RimL family protein N-acetyltransferase
MAATFQPEPIENAWLAAKPFAEGYREALRAAAADPDLWRFHMSNMHGAAFDSYFDGMLGQAARGEGLGWVLLDKASGAVAGSSSFLAVSMPNKRLEIGSTWYPKRFQGGHVNPAAKLLLMEYAFETLGLNRIEFKVDARNARSLAAMTKLGAVREGVFRSHMVLPDGFVRDSVYFSVIVREWPAMKARLMERLGG